MIYNLNLKKYFAVVLSIIMILAIGISGFAEPWQRGRSKGHGRAPAQGVKKSDLRLPHKKALSIPVIVIIGRIRSR